MGIGTLAVELVLVDGGKGKRGLSLAVEGGGGLAFFPATGG